MNLGVSMNQQLSQALTTELIQHLEILQFSEAELTNHIYDKANENPLINVIDGEIKQMKNVIDMSMIKTFDSFSKHDNETHSFILSNIIQKEPSEKYLFEQIPMHQDLSKLDRRILKYLIYHLDDHYFLNVNLQNVAYIFRVTLSHVESLLDLLQTFEPIGVGARNFTENLLIKIANDSKAPELAYPIVQNHLQHVADFSVKTLSNLYKTSTINIKDVIDYIRSLDPPLSRSADIREEYIIPDVEVKKVGSEWVIDVYNPACPKVEINEEYVEILKNDIDHKEYYKECLKDVMLLMQGLKQRDKTIYSVTRLLLKLQPAFFESGMAALTSMRLKDMAIALEVHESTVSRAIRNKYIRTPQGIFALRSLFTKGITNSSGKMDSVQYIKKRLQEMIFYEEKKSPLSDQQLTNDLVNEGIQISRRTVAKYREELNIPSSNKRLYA